MPEKSCAGLTRSTQPSCASPTCFSSALAGCMAPTEPWGLSLDSVIPRNSVEHAMAEYILAHRMLSVQRLAHELAHDFRNMLMNIASLVLQLEKEQPTRMVIDKVHAIRFVLANLEEMVHHLQTIGDQEEGKDNRVVHDLARELEPILDSMRPSIDPSIRLAFHAASESLHVLIRADVFDQGGIERGTEAGVGLGDGLRPRDEPRRLDRRGEPFRSGLLLRGFFASDRDPASSGRRLNAWRLGSPVRRRVLESLAAQFLNAPKVRFV